MKLTSWRAVFESTKKVDKTPVFLKAEESNMPIVFRCKNGYSFIANIKAPLPMTITAATPSGPLLFEKVNRCKFPSLSIKYIEYHEI